MLDHSANSADIFVKWHAIWGMPVDMQMNVGSASI